MRASVIVSVAAMYVSSMALSGCSRQVEERAPVAACAPLPDYPDYVLATAAQELAYLPDGSTVEQMLYDYRFLRCQLSDWHTATCRG